MEIYELAMQMEKEGENYYRGLASKTDHHGLKSILGMLADAKAKQYNLFTCLERRDHTQTTDTALLAEVKKIFTQMKKEKKSGGTLPDITLYRHALERESKLIDLYRSKADEIKDPAPKEAFLKIAREEEKHFSILEEIVEFMTRPDTWLENPEWYHLEEY
jgi:rubrerythrin